MNDLLRTARTRDTLEGHGKLAQLIAESSVHLDRCGVCSAIAYVNNIDHVCWDCKAWLEKVNERTG